MLTPQEWEARDAIGVAALVKSGEINAREAVETAIARIEQLNPVLNAVIHRAFDNAIETASRQKPTGPFAGVPYLLKDLNAPAQGLPLTNGSRLLAESPATFDSSVVARLKAAGFIILGRTNSAEFGLNITTEPVAYGATRNPWQLDRIAGGSSGGSAAAVASGMVPAAHATDSGGSIRIIYTDCRKRPGGLCSNAFPATPASHARSRREGRSRFHKEAECCHSRSGKPGTPWASPNSSSRARSMPGRSWKPPLPASSS